MAQVMEEEVCPVFNRLVFDCTPSVRLALARVVGTWLCQQGAGAAAAASAQGEGEEHEEGDASASAYHFEVCCFFLGNPSYLSSSVRLDVNVYCALI